MNLKEKYDSLLEKQNILNEKLKELRDIGVVELNENGGNLNEDASLLELIKSTDDKVADLKTYMEKNQPNVIIPEETEKIRSYSFAGSDIEKIVIPDFVTQIENHAFKDCKNLKEVTLSSDNNYYSYSSHAFEDCPNNIKATLTKGQSSIIPSTDLWGHCEEIVIEEGITINNNSYNDSIFSNIKNLKKITIPSSLKEIPDISDPLCIDVYSPSLETWCEVNGEYEDAIEIFNGGGKLYCNNIFIEDLSFLPDSVTEIKNCFSGYHHFKSIEIPKNVTKLGEYTFYECPNLENVILHNNITQISRDTFFDTPFFWKNFKNNEVFINNYLLFGIYINQSTINIKSGTVLIADLFIVNENISSTITIPASVKHINEKAFYKQDIKAINVNSSNQYFSSQNGVLFNKSKSDLIYYPILKTGVSYTIPKTVKTIKTYAFGEDLEYLEKVIMLDDSVKIIEKKAFDDCSSLKEITLSNSIKYIDANAFDTYDPIIINCPWEEEEIPGAPWGAWNATINYNYGKEES